MVDDDERMRQESITTTALARFHLLFIRLLFPPTSTRFLLAIRNFFRRLWLGRVSLKNIMSSFLKSTLRTFDHSHQQIKTSICTFFFEAYFVILAIFSMTHTF